MTWRYSKGKLVAPADVVPAFITKQPEPDESLVGFIDRTFARTVFANPIAALAQAGIATNRPEYIAGADLAPDQLAVLAVRLGVDVSEIRSRLHPKNHMPGSGVRGIDFHGQFLRLTFLERVRRRVSPRALEASPHHRAIWDVRPLAFDPGTMELLLADCPVCGTQLGRRQLCGPEKCDSCKDERGLPLTDLRDHPQPLVPDELREMLRAIAGLVDTDPDTRARSCLRFPEPWQALGPGDIFHLLAGMSVAYEGISGYLTIASALPLRPGTLHRVGTVLAGGTDAFHEWAVDNLASKDLPHWTIDRPVATDGFERLRSSLHLSPATKTLIMDLRDGSRSALRSKRIGAFAWLNARDLAPEFGLTLTRSQSIVTRLKSALHNTEDPKASGLPTTKAAFAALLSRASGTVAPNRAAFLLGAGVEVVAGLEEIGALAPVPAPVDLMVEAEKSYYEADVVALRERFLVNVGRARDPSILPSVSTAIRNSGLKPLPVSAAWHLVMTGSVDVVGADRDIGDWMRDIRLVDETAFAAALVTHPLTRAALDLPDRVTTLVAARMMDCDIVVIGQLVRNGILVPIPGTRPLLFPRSDIERFAAGYVSTPELKRALGIETGGRLELVYPDLPDSAFRFPGQRSRFYHRKDCASILAAARHGQPPLVASGAGYPSSGCTR
nr:hypothetical protein [uncultured Devosia sp.]